MLQADASLAMFAAAKIPNHEEYSAEGPEAF